METSLPDRNNITTHRQAREHGHEILRRNVIDAASRLLVEEGPDALTVRRIAHVLDCSTKVIYTMFKGKEGLADALYVEGCSSLEQAIGQVPKAADPAVYLRDIAWAYWEFALANPSYYLVMFCGAIPNFQPSTTSIGTTMTAFEAVVGTIQQYMEQKSLPVGDPFVAVKAVWAPLHGVVSLYLTGHFATREEAKDVFGRTVRALIAVLPSGGEEAQA